MGCSVAFGLPKITLHVTKQENLQGSSRPNGLFGGFWSAENYFVHNKTGGFERLEQTKRVVRRLLVCRKLLYTQQNGRICKARADQMGCSVAFGLLKITLYVAKQEDLQGSSRPNGLFGGFWSAENHFVRNKTGGFARFEQTKWAIFLHLVCFFAEKQTESRRSAHSIKKRPALLQAERNFSRFR